MNCENCKRELPDDVKICNYCGTSISKKTDVDIEKVKKNLKNTGNSFFAIGIITIIANIGIYIWSILDKSYLEFGLPAVDLSGTFLTIVIASIFVILGNRIRKTVDIRMKLYLKILLGLSLITLVWVLMSGGRVGFFFLLIIGYLVSSLVSINKAMKVKEFTDTLTNPEYKLNKRGWIIFAVIVVVLFVVAVKIDLSMRTMDKFLDQVGNDKSIEETVDQIVKEIKVNSILPNKIDEITTLVNITAQLNAIRYHYILSEIPTNDVDNDILKQNLVLGACQDKDVISLLNSGINLEYLYVVENTDQEYFVSITKEDCLK